MDMKTFVSETLVLQRVLALQWFYLSLHQSRGAAHGNDLDPGLMGPLIHKELPPIGYWRVGSSQLFSSPPPQNVTMGTMCVAVRPILEDLHYIMGR